MAFGITAGTSGDLGTTNPNTLATPASVVSGDLLLAFFETGNATTSITATGWTTIKQHVGGTSTGQTNGVLLAKIADGTEGASVSFTFNGTLNHWSGRMFRITGHGVSNVSTDIVVGTGGTGASGAASCTGVTSVAANDLVMLFCTDASDQSGTTFYSAWASTNIAAGNWTEHDDNGTIAGNGGSRGVASAINTAGGATGNGSVTRSLTTAAWTLVMISIPQAGAGPAVRPFVAMGGRSTAYNNTQDSLDTLPYPTAESMMVPGRSMLSRIIQAPVAAGNVNIDISTPGQVAVTGQALTTTTNIALTAGSVAVTGQTLTTTTNIALTAGSVAVTGQALTTTQNVALTAAAVTVVGQTLTTTTNVALGAGSVAVTGQTLTTSTGTLVDTPGQVAVTGQTLTTTINVALGAGLVAVVGRTLTTDTSGPVNVNIDVAGLIQVLGQTLTVVTTPSDTTSTWAMASYSTGVSWWHGS